MSTIQVMTLTLPGTRFKRFSLSGILAIAVLLPGSSIGLAAETEQAPAPDSSDAGDQQTEPE